MMNTILCKRNEKFNMLTQSELELVVKNYREPSLFKFGENFSSLVCYRIAKTPISKKLARQHHFLYHFLQIHATRSLEPVTRVL